MTILNSVTLKSWSLGEKGSYVQVISSKSESLRTYIQKARDLILFEGRWKEQMRC